MPDETAVLEAPPEAQPEPTEPPKKRNPFARRFPVAIVDQCREDYVSGKGTLTDLAKRYNVTEGALTQWCRHGLWVAERDRRRIADRERKDNGWATTDLNINPAGISPSTINGIAQVYYAGADNVRRHLERVDQMMFKTNNPNTLAALTKTRGMLQTQLREIAGIKQPNGRGKSGNPHPHAFRKVAPTAEPQTDNQPNNPDADTPTGEANAVS